MAKTKFRISSALKNIIGRELITNDFIAVFELVKNAFDAHATKVEINFEDLETAHPKIVIKDNGKGMDETDLKEKWLFVAYSAKKDGTEDYRDNITSTRIHAGAKGIGRFSCDRLGSTLKIYSKKKQKEKTETVDFLSVKWQDFEEDSKLEFDEISVEYLNTKKDPYKVKRGTVLEISDLREDWDRDKLLRLRRSLEKLINPNQGNDSKNFSVIINVPSELEADSVTPSDEPWKIVNGPVKNFLFENLGLKTTFIRVKISADGRTMQTTLEDRGTLIFKLLEKNPLKYSGKFLKDVEITLFALNRSAKMFFTRYMGIRVVNYGSVFLYKNGFRIHPVGEVGDDSLGIDSRKSQGTSRFLGTRDLVGRIEINGENKDFQEVTSRDGGLVKNKATDALQELFLEYCLKRLEKYAVDIVKFGNLGEDFADAVKQNSGVRSQVLNLIQSLTKSTDILDFTYDEDVVDILGELSEQSLQNVLSNFRRIAASSNNSKLEKEAAKAQARLVQLNRAREEAEAQAKKAQKAQAEAEKTAQKEAVRAREAEQESAKAKELVEQTTTQKLFLASIVSQDLTNVISLHHHIGIAAHTIENYIADITTTIASGKSYSTEQLLDVFDKISRQARKIATTTKFATKANFNLEATVTELDVCNYIEEYVLNVNAGVVKTKDRKRDIAFEWENPDNIVHEINCRPLELSIILDNLINNSKKANAQKISLHVLRKDDQQLHVIFADDGSGMPKSIHGSIFDLGFSTTDGSGLGLHQTREAMRQMKGDIHLISSSKGGGTTFDLVFPK